MADGGGLEQPAGNLVQERLEGVVVVGVHQHDVHRRVLQFPGGADPREAPTEDDHARARCRRAARGRRRGVPGHHRRRRWRSASHRRRRRRRAHQGSSLQAVLGHGAAPRRCLTSRRTRCSRPAHDRRPSPLRRGAQPASPDPPSGSAAPEQYVSTPCGDSGANPQPVRRASRAQTSGPGGARRHGTERDGGGELPGLLRGVARTAVVAGTWTAVSNGVSRRQAGRWAAQAQAPADGQAAAAAQQAYARKLAMPPPPGRYRRPLFQPAPVGTAGAGGAVPGAGHAPRRRPAGSMDAKLSMAPPAGGAEGPGRAQRSGGRSAEARDSRGLTERGAAHRHRTAPWQASPGGRPDTVRTRRRLDIFSPTAGDAHRSPLRDDAGHAGSGSAAAEGADPPAGKAGAKEDGPMFRGLGMRRGGAPGAAPAPQRRRRRTGRGRPRRSAIASGCRSGCSPSATTSTWRTPAGSACTGWTARRCASATPCCSRTCRARSATRSRRRWSASGRR